MNTASDSEPSSFFTSSPWSHSRISSRIRSRSRSRSRNSGAAARAAGGPTPGAARNDAYLVAVARLARRHDVLRRLELAHLVQHARVSSRSQHIPQEAAGAQSGCSHSSRTLRSERTELTATSFSISISVSCPNTDAAASSRRCSACGSTSSRGVRAGARVRRRWRKAGQERSGRSHWKQEDAPGAPAAGAAASSSYLLPAPPSARCSCSSRAPSRRRPRWRRHSRRRRRPRRAAAPDGAAAV